MIPELPLCKGVTCEANSECVVRDGTAMCDCKLGYRKSGNTCQGEKLLCNPKWTPVWKNLVALVSLDEFEYCEYNAYFTVEG